MPPPPTTPTPPMPPPTPTYPPPPTPALSALNPLTWVSAACVNAEFAAFDTNVILTFASVVVACLFVWLVYGARTLMPFRQGADEHINNHALYSQHMSAFLFVTYLTYPSLAKLQFQGLDW